MSLSLQLSDTRELNLPDQQVWAFLSDMEQVAVCAPGFRSLTPPTQLPYAEKWTAHIRILGIGMNIIINRSLCDPVQQRMLVQAFGKKLGSEVMLDVELDLDPQDSQHTRVTWKAIISIQGPVAAAGQRAVERDIQRFFDTLLARLQAWASAAQVSVPPPSAKQPGRLISWQPWLWPWYLIAGFATLILATLVASTTGPNQQITALSLLALTVLAAGIMLLERLPEILILVASLAVWTTCWGFAKPDPTRTLSILALLCVPLFATQYIWRGRLSTQRPFLEQALPRILGMGGLLLLFPISLAFTAGQRSVPNLPAQVVALVWLLFVLLLLWLAHIQLDAVARRLCDYAAPTLISLLVPWELYALTMTSSPDLLTLVPSITLALTVPVMVRDATLQNTPFGRRRFTLGSMLCAAATLLLPAFLASLDSSSQSSQTQFLAILILLVGALGLYGYGLLPWVQRIQYFSLSAWCIAILATVRAIFFVIEVANSKQDYQQAQVILVLIVLSACILLANVLWQILRNSHNSP